jgi:plasmid maintenance system killer protein
MKVYISDPDLIDLKDGVKNRRYAKYAKNKKFMAGLYRVLDIMQRIEKANMLSIYSYLHYEKLIGNNKSSVRIVNGMVERLIFREIDDGVEIEIIELNTDHYGNKK